MAKKLNNAITDVPGIRVGHASDFTGITGCTVVLSENGAVAGVDQRGGGPGTRETDLLRPMHSVKEAHAVLLTGGSAFGLNAAGGIMQYLEERDKGYKLRIPGVPRVPIVPAAVIFDLAVGDPHARPDSAMAYQACQNATDGAIEQGSIGAGTGATVGKMLGSDYAMKGGIGTASVELGGGLIVGALVAVNCVGDVVDPENGQVIAGVRKPPAGKEFAGSLNVLKSFMSKAMARLVSSSNTVIGVVATNAKLNKEEINKVAQMAHNGLARVVRPAHMMMDGDTIFALATGKKQADVNLIGAYAAESVAQAIVNAILQADSLGGYPAVKDL